MAEISFIEYAYENYLSIMAHEQYDGSSFRSKSRHRILGFY